MTLLERARGGLLGLSLLCLLSPAASATLISGTLGFAGPGVLTFSTGNGAPGTNFIDWCPVNVGPAPEGSNCGVAGQNPYDGDPFPTSEGKGLVAVQSASGSFAPVDPFLSLGSILDITDDPTPPAPYTYVPSGGPVVVPNFLDFSDPWLYTLTSVETQTCTPSATQFCTGMFKLVQVGSSVSVNMAMRGFITAGADDTPFTLLITGNFANTNIGAVLAAATTRTGMFSHSWSGELTASPIPEPGTVAMGFLGIVGVGVGRIFTRRLSR